MPTMVIGFTWGYTSSMNLNHLQHFLAVAENGSVRAAADALGLSQPAVSKSVRLLESTLGVPLIQRGTRGSTLTAFGNALYSRARLIGNELERMTDELHQLAGTADGHVALGTSATASFALLPKALPAFRAANPRVRVDVVGGLPNILLPQLADGSLDLVVGPRPVQPMPAQVDSWKLFERPSVIAVRQGHPLEHARSLASFADAEWVLNSCAGRAESSLQAAFLAVGLKRLVIALHADSLFAAYTMIARTDYVGVLPRAVVDEGITRDVLSVVEVPEFTAIDSIELFFRRNAPLSAAAIELAAVLRREAQRVRPRTADATAPRPTAQRVPA